MKERERILAAIADAAPGMPVDDVVALLLAPSASDPDAAWASRRLLREMEERVKELTALHESASLLQDNSIAAAEVLRRIAELLPPAFQFPDDCVARVVHAEVPHETRGWRETPWLLRAAFRTADGEDGFVEVAYLEERPAAAEGPFLAEERRLVDSVAAMIATALDRRRTEEQLRLFVGTGRIRLIEWDVPAERYTWPGIPSPGASGGGGPLTLTREEVDRGIHPDDLGGFRRQLDAAIADPLLVGFSCEFRSAMQPGNYTWRHLTAHVIRGDDGSAERVVAISVDITAQKALEARLRETQKLEALGRLAGGVAHDFNNILVAIMGYANLAAERIPETDPGRKYLLEVSNASRSAVVLVRQILAFGRRQELQPRKVDLRTIVRDMDGMLASLLEKRVELRHDFAPDTPDAIVDPNQFQQVVLNLCVNARDAMPDGGSIMLRTRREPAGAPRQDGGRGAPHDWTIFEVEDTGTGMPPAVRERLFEPFFTTKPEGKGTGLGLATVHGIVKQSGGFIDVESVVGRGTLFRAYFPVA